MTNLIEIRDYLTETLENIQLGQSKNIPFNADPDGRDIDFGFGIAFTQLMSVEPGDSGSEITTDVTNGIKAFEALLPSNLFISPSDLSALTTALTSALTPYATVLANNNPNAPGLTPAQKAAAIAAIKAAAAAATTQLNKTVPFEIWQPIAVAAMDNFYTTYIPPIITAKLSNLTSLSANAQTALQLMAYVAGNTFLGSSIVADLKESTPDYASAAYELAFDTAYSTYTHSGANAFVAYENRCLVSASIMLGLSPTINGYGYITGFTDIGVSSSTNATVVGFLQKLAANTSQVARYTAISLNGGSPAADFFNSITSYLLSQGYYVPQSTSAATWTNIANYVGSVTGFAISGTTLQQINAAFTDSSLKSGGLVHVPVASQALGDFTTDFPVLPKSQTYVVDAASGTVYTVGASLDGHDGGGMVIDTPISGTSSCPLFDSGTYSTVSQNGGTLGIALEDPSGDALGTLFIDPAAGTSSFTLTGGMTVALPALTSPHITYPANAATATPMDVLSGYLSELGFTGNLSALNYSYDNPTGKAYTVAGSVSGSTDTFTLSNAAPGAVVTGKAGDTNVLDIAGGTASDLSQDAVSGVQVLDLLTTNPGTQVTATQAQLAAFSAIKGAGTIIVTTRGTFSLLTSAANDNNDQELRLLAV